MLQRGKVVTQFFYSTTWLVCAGFLVTVLLFSYSHVSSANTESSTDKTTEVYEAIQTQQQAIDVLFVAYDNGDGRAFQQLIPELEAKKLNWKIVTFGPAAKLFSEQDEYVMNINQNMSAPLQEAIYQNRALSLPTNLKQRMLDSFRPKVVVTGMAHQGQAQLSDMFHGQGAWSIAFYDNLESPEGQAWVRHWFENVTPVSDELLVTMPDLSAHFSNQLTYHKKNTIVQHPAVAAWGKTIQDEDAKALKQQLKLDDRPVIVIAGGYGDAYQKSLLLMESVAENHPEIQWLLAPHPRVLDRQNELPPLSPAIKMITTVPTNRLVAIADVVMSHRSTVVWMSAMSNIAGIFVRPEDSVSRTKHNVYIANNVTALDKAVLSQIHKPTKGDNLKEPESSQQSLVDLIVQRLAKTQ